MFDLLEACSILRTRVQTGKVAVGIDHGMRDFARNRAKNLDLVICTTAGTERHRATFAGLVTPYTVMLSDADRAALEALPQFGWQTRATVLMALEARACMTAFGKARPRLYDELNSSHLTIHGDPDGASAAGFALVNSAETFVSPIRNPWSLLDHEPAVSRHSQPKDLCSAAAKLTELPRRPRARRREVRCIRDHCDRLLQRWTASRNQTRCAGGILPGIFDYAQTTGRLAELYATRFSSM